MRCIHFFASYNMAYDRAMLWLADKPFRRLANIVTFRDDDSAKLVYEIYLPAKLATHFGYTTS